MIESTSDLVGRLKGPIVIIGASGFIGANLFRRLLCEREDVYGLIHEPFVPWRLLGLEQSRMLHCDVTQAVEVQSALNRLKPQTLFVLSAYGGRSQQTDSLRIYETNVMGLLNILDATRVQGFASLVHAGSSSEYGLNAKAPSEDGPLKPNSHYAVSKISCAYLLFFAAQQQSLPVVDLRLYSVYGPWEDPDRLIPRLVHLGLQGKYPPFVDPEISRDFVYIEDVVDAFLLAAIRGVQKAPGQWFNIATGRRTSMRDVASEAQRLFGIQGEPSWSSMPNRFWDLKDWYGNPRLAEEVLGWKAATLFSDGLRKTADWMRERSLRPEIRSEVRLARPARLSAVIACYKDGQAVPIMHERLTRIFQDLGVDYEIIFVNDGSPDDTHEILSRLGERDEHLIEVEHSRNFGSQSAFLSGLGIATGDAVILLDGDLQDPPELIKQFHQKWLEGYEVVYGRRVTRQASWWMNLFFKAFYRLFNFMSYVPIPVDAGDFSLMDRRVVRELLALPETDQFLRGLRAWLGFRQTYVDYQRQERVFGRSTNNWIRNIWWARKGIFSFSFMPLDLLFYGGILLTLLSIAALIWQIIYRLLHPSMEHGLTTILVLILFFGGVQLMGLSILGEYVGKLLEETKHRPKYLRRSIRIGRRQFTSSDEIGRLMKSRTSRTDS